MDGYQASTYGDAFADVYDDWYPGLNNPETVADLLDGLHDRGRVLELGIGTGRLARPLAARDRMVFGVDASTAMLSRLGGQAADDEVIRGVKADMAQLPFAAGTFGLAFVAYNTLFNLPDLDSQRWCFDSVGRCLAPGGAFVIEAFVPHPEDESVQGVAVRDIAIDRVVMTASRLDPVDQTITGQHIEIRESGIRLRPWFLHYLHPEQIDELAAAAGLQLEQRFAGWNREPFGPDSESHVSVYRRT